MYAGPQPNGKIFWQAFLNDLSHGQIPTISTAVSVLKLTKVTCDPLGRGRSHEIMALIVNEWALIPNLLCAFQFPLFVCGCLSRVWSISFSALSLWWHLPILPGQVGNKRSVISSPPWVEARFWLDWDWALINSPWQSQYIYMAFYCLLYFFLRSAALFYIPFLFIWSHATV